MTPLTRRAALALAPAALAGCGSLHYGGVNFKPAAFAFMLGDLKDLYNSVAGFANRAAEGGLLMPAEVQALADSGKQAIALYEDLRRKTIESSNVDAEALVQVIAKLAALAGRVYGIPIPTPTTGPPLYTPNAPIRLPVIS